MSEDITVLGLAVDSTGVLSASEALDRMAASGGKAETAATSIEAAFKKANAAASSINTAGVSTSASGAAAALDRQAASLKGVADGSKLTAFQSQQLGYQLNDLFVQIQAGQSPLTALIQQGSQLNGTFGGTAGTLRAISTLFTASRVAIGGAAAAIGAVALAAYEGAQQSAALEKALALTGNAAGVTGSQVDTMAKSIATSTKSGAGTAREALQELIASGRFGGTALTAAGTAAVQFSKLTGESLDDVSKKFVSLADNTAKGAAQLNDQYHFLSASQLEQIKDLDDQGDHTKALTLVFDSLNGRLNDAAGKVGALGSAWNSLKGYVNSATDAIEKAGRTASTQEQLDGVRAQLAQKGRSGVGAPSSVVDTNPRSSTFGTSPLQALLEQEASLSRRVKLEDSIAFTAGQMVETDRAASAFDKLKEQSLTRQEKLARDIANANAQADNANRGGETKVTAADRAKVIAGIRERYKEPVGPDDDPTKALLENATKAIQRQVQTEKDLLGERNRFIDLYNRENLLSVSAYYSARKAAADEAAAAELKSYDDEVSVLRKHQSTAGDKDRAEDQGKIDAALAKKAALQKQVSSNSIELSVQESRAQQELQKQFDGVNAALLERQNRLKEAAAITFDQQYETVNKRATAEGDSTTLGRVAALRASTLAQADYNEKSIASSSILAQLQIQEDAVSTARQRGTVSELASLQEVGAYRQTAIDQLQSIVAAEEAIARASPTDNGLATKAIQARAELERLKAEADPLGDKFRNVFEGSATDAFTEFITGAKGAKAAFGDFAHSITQQVAGLAANSLSTAIFGSLFNKTAATTAAGATSSSAVDAIQAAATAAKTADTTITTTHTVSVTTNTLAIDAMAASAIAATAALTATAAAAGSSGLASIFDKFTLAGSSPDSVLTGAAFSGGFGSGALDSIGDLLFDLLPGFASGGSIGANTVARVAEKGPELLQQGGQTYLLSGNQGGYITPNNQLQTASSDKGSSGGDVHINNPVYNIGQGVSRSEVIAGIQSANNALKADILRSRRTGGAFA